LQIFKLKGADRKHKQDRDKIQKRPFAEQEKFSPSYECTVLSDLPAEHIYIPLNNSANGNTSTSNTSIPLPPLQMGQGVNSSRSNTPNRVISNHPTNPSVTGSQPATTTTPLKRAESISPSFQSVSKPVQKNISTGVYQPVNSSDCVPVLSRNGSPALYTTDQKFSIDTNAFVGANNLSMSGAETPEQQTANEILPQITSTSTPEMVSHWLGNNRYTDHLNSFQHYNGRDILRYEI
jgi:transcription factor CP2-like protein